MRSDRLEELLRHADAHLPPRPAAGALLERVRARGSRRTRAQVSLAIIASLAIATITMHWTHPRTRVAGPASAKPTVLDVAQCRAELARLDALAALHRRAADAIEAIQREQSSGQQVAQHLLHARDPLAHLAEARDRAARIMLLDADRLQATPGEQPRVQAIYRRAVQLFPDTAAAHEAAERLRGAGA